VCLDPQDISFYDCIRSNLALLAFFNRLSFADVQYDAARFMILFESQVEILGVMLNGSFEATHQFHFCVSDALIAVGRNTTGGRRDL
jgi:hypothetical protein